MTINNTISLAEANQDFTAVTKQVDQNGAVIILKNNAPRYVVMEFAEFEKLQTASDEDIAEISQQLIKKNLEAYKELAK